MRSLAPGERRLLAIAILVALVGIVLLGIVAPVIGGMASRAEERRELIATYVRNQHVMAGIPAWRAEAVKQKATAGSFAIVAPTGALAAEMLKQRINRMAAEEGGTVGSVSEIQGD